MQTDKCFRAEASKWAVRLTRGTKNLEAMKRAAANPKMSEAGKKTLERAIVMQAKINAMLEKILSPPNGRPKGK